MKKALRYLAAWVALALCFGALVGSLNIPRLRTLASEGVKARGTVIALEPTNHRAVRYSYQVGNATYSGVGSDGYGNPDFDSLDTGDSILLYYGATAPATSVLGEPRARLRNEVSSVVSVMLFFPSIIVLAFIAKRGSA
ncbi:hypothetical protein GCM10027159_14550 [Lysobacter terrae]